MDQNTEHLREMVRKFCDEHPNPNLCSVTPADEGELWKEKRYAAVKIASPMDDVKVEMVDHPDHYAEGRKYEPKDVIRDWKLNFNLGSAVKYIARCGRKPNVDPIEDLRKAREYLDFEIDYLLKERAEKE